MPKSMSNQKEIRHQLDSYGISNPRDWRNAFNTRTPEEIEELKNQAKLILDDYLFSSDMNWDDGDDYYRYDYRFDDTLREYFQSKIKNASEELKLEIVKQLIKQEEISGVDIRVTVIGNEVFPCRIDKNTSAQEEVDWRRIQLDNVLTYSLDEEFPYSLAQLCREMIKILGLEFGAIDFMKQGDEYYFLEINPNGQWGFVELEAGIQISQSFAELIRSKIRD